MRILSRRLLVWAGALTVAGSGFAYMAGNTVNPSNIGEGVGAVSGYTVSNIHYSGLISPNPGMALPNNDYTDMNHVPQGNAGTMEWTGYVRDGFALQDGVTTVSFQLTPDNANWAAVTLYNSGKTAIGGGGASNCGETNGWWTCNVSSNGSPVPAQDIAYIDVEAAQ